MNPEWIHVVQERAQHMQDANLLDETAEAIIRALEPLIRADERGRASEALPQTERKLRAQIARDIEALHSEYDPSGSGDRWHACMDQREHDLLERAAAIARGDG